MDIHALGRTPREADRLYRKQVERAWQAMVERGPAANVQVRDVIRDSWARCLQLGIEPVGQRPRDRGNGAALEALRHANEELLEASENTWRVLGDILSQSQSCLLVADASGILLDVRGSSALLDRAARDCIAPGYAWSELSAGTNAVGTAIALNAPAEVHSAEHFLSVAKIWSCSAAPVRDVIDGSMIGVVDVTSVGENHQTHCLALAVTAAHQIEQTLHSRELARAVQLLHWYQTSGSRWSQQAVVVIDRKGRIVTANDLARAWFADCRDCTPLERGRQFLNVVGEPTLADCAAALPPRTRVVGIEPFAGRGEAWEGGLLVLEPVRESRLAGSSLPARKAPDPIDAFVHITGRNAALVELKRRAARMARAGAPVLLLGESGVGKELFARAIHQASPVAAGPLLAVNCGTLTRELAASELFGYEAGAFTGAAPKGRAGKFEEADGGTLFLDEIGELPLDVQVGLLRVLQDNVVLRVGGNQERKVKVRIIAATNRDLEEDVAAGRFRLDLLYRLKVLSLRVPPLRERLDDLQMLVDRFVTRLHEAYGLGRKRVAPALLAALEAHAWPGNVRELHGVVESMYVLSDSDELTPADLPEGFALSRVVEAGALPAEAPRSISRMARAAIEAELAANGNNLSEVARRLGISRSTLYRKIKRYGLNVD
jgi:transcriptional regulator of acetoin/glycerol metabolism